MRNKEEIIKSFNEDWEGFPDRKVFYSHLIEILLDIRDALYLMWEAKMR